jgi:MraZ protein
MLDSMNRLLVPKNLMDFAGLSKDVVFLGVEGIVEVWDKSRYEASKMPQDDFEQLAGEIFGDDFKLYE